MSRKLKNSWKKKCSSILTVNNAYLNSNFLKINVKYFRHKNIVPLYCDSYSRLLKLLLVFWTFVSSCELCACVFVWKWLRIFSYNLTIRFFWRRKVGNIFFPFHNHTSFEPQIFTWNSRFIPRKAQNHEQSIPFK